VSENTLSENTMTVAQQQRTTHKLFVCKTCAFSKQERERDGKSGGQELLERLTVQHSNWELQSSFPIQAVECMSSCNRHCVIAFSAPGKYTYLFGDIPPDADVEAVLECANLYAETADGFLPWSVRPQPLKNGILARIPPISD
jgi:predicted metal-binding protein